MNRLFLLFISVFFVLLSNGQQISYLNVADGLSSRHTYGIEQDKKGFIWFATNEGIDRFDGSEFKNYSLNSASTLPSDLGYRFNITTDSSGVIWAYTTSGKIFKHDAYTDAFILEFDLADVPNDLNWDPYVFNIFIDKLNRIWIGTTVGIFYAVPGITDLPIHISGQQRTFAFEESETGEIWAGTNNGVLTFGSGEQHDDINIIDSPLEKTTQNIQVRSLYYNKINKQLWIGSDNKGPSVYHIQNNNWINLQTLTAGVPIRSIHPDMENNILIGLDGAGIVSVDPINFKKVGNWEKLNDNQLGLSDNSVLDIFCDPSGKIWVSTWSEGITMLDVQKPGIEIIRHKFHQNNSLKDNNVNSVFQDSDNDIWFGTNDGVSILTSDEQWDHLAGVEGVSNISGYKILALCEDNQRRIWIGGYANGLHCYDKKSKRLINYTDKTGSNHIYAIYYDSKDHIWFGGTDGNLTVLNLKTNSFTQFPLENITCITSKSEDEIWAGGTTGIFVANKKNGEVGNAVEDVFANLSNHYINSVYHDQNHDLWISTNGGGLNLYNVANDSVEILSVEHGLPSNFVCGVLKDRNKRIWISTDKGICCFDPDQKVSINIGTIQGLTNGSFNNNALEKLNNGDLIFGSSSGAIRITPENFQKQKANSQLFLNDFKVSYHTVKPSSKKSPLQHPIDETETIFLNYNQNSFSFHFSTINFDNSDQLVYRWKLENFETDWTPLSSSKMAGYTNIPSGEYVFQLECVNRNDLEPGDSRSITIVIAPPFYESKTAYLFYILFVFALVLLIHRLQQDRLQKKHSNDKIRFFINTAHDIKTPLSLIKAPLKDLETDKGITSKGMYFLKLAQTNVERLSGIVSQVLDFDKYDSGKFKLNLTYNNLNSYLSEKVESYDSLAKPKEIKLKLKLPKSDIKVEFDVDKMDKIMDNLISNAIKYTPQKGNVKIIATENENDWFIKVIDNGIGIPKKNQKDLFKLYYRAENAVNSKNPGSGIGLMLSQRLVKMHQGRISFSSLENKGSTFTLRFPKTSINEQDIAQISFHNGSENKQELIQEEINEQFVFTQSVLPETQKKVLVVEDDKDLRNYLKGSLQSKYIVSCAPDGEMALEMVNSEKFDLIISDVMMPKLSGDKLCQKIKENIDTSHIPVILLTALSDKKNTIIGLEAGADSYVNKPFDIEVIYARIENIFKNRLLLRESLITGISPPAEKVLITNLDQDFVQKLMIIVNEELPNPEFTINDLCRKVGMSRTILYEKIKALTNLAPNEFIRINRMNRAIDLLKTGQHSIAEVGFMVGFQDPKYFSTAFKKFFGKSPRHYLP